MTDDPVRPGGAGGDSPDSPVEESLRRAASTKDHLAKERVDQELRRRVEQRSAAVEPAGRHSLIVPVAVAVVLSAAVLGLTLLRGGDGLAPSLLAAVAMACLIFLVVRYWTTYYLRRVRDLQAQLATAQDELGLAHTEHRTYLEALERTSERERSVFTEELEIELWIGHDDEGDRVVERRVTRPEQLVSNRTMRPIVPNDEERLVRLADLGFETRREPDGGMITVLPLQEKVNWLKVWLVFDPVLTTPTEWTATYRPRGLWRPLRQHGRDQLIWDDRPGGASGTTTRLTTMTVSFRFPGGTTPTVAERHLFGETTAPARMPDGSWEVVWRDRSPAGRRYVWDLTQPVADRGQGGT
ncbi:hypothetical protein COUCH_19965 [Couchioplanes caeruleus]|uniref:hypothetical protein n=1 Tax=Couchioplanes caeruleus TaxID=56438 RepID=UPI0020BEA56D|nr:hypothetical protein [Couchioplanes caeruleus]UQU61341.1 hypothetical protein COUCH_19965 [Couchioplanes caeruleus]